MEHLLRLVSQALFDSYLKVGGLNHTEGENLPSKRAIATLCSELLTLLFPGFHDDGPQTANDLLRATEQRVCSLSERLNLEICRSMRQKEPRCPMEPAQEIGATFLMNLPGIREQLRWDVDAAFDGDPAASGTAEIILAYPGIEAIAIQRCAHTLYLARVPILPRMMTEWAHARTGIDIHPGARIGTHFFIDHGTGVVIGETAEVGSHVRLYQGVSLIARSLSGGQALKGKKRHPTIEDNVTIYANATIMGGDTVVGAGSTVGGNVFLSESLPARSLAVAHGHSVRVLTKHPPAQGW